MKLCDLLGLVAGAASGIPLDKINEVEPSKMAQIAKDIHLEQLGKDLIFRKVTGKKAEVSEDLLLAQSRMPACMLFSFAHEDKHWSVMETDTVEELKDLLDSKVDDASYRYVIMGAHWITDKVQQYSAKLGHYRGSLLIELTPTC